MSDTTGRTAGLMVLRLWTEETGALRVRITASGPGDGTDAVTSYAATQAEVLAIVRDWLESLVTAR